MQHMTRERNVNIRVMLVATHQIFVAGLQRLIDDHGPQLNVVATAGCCTDALVVADSAKPDVMVLDVDLLEGTEDEVVPSLFSGQDMRVLILGDSKLHKMHEAAILRGACGVVDKSETPETLIKAIKKVHEGQLWLDRSTTGRLFVELSKQKSRAVPDPEAQKLAALTVREQEVVRTLAKAPGADNKTLASALHIGEHTLRNHLCRIYDKLGVSNRVELYLLAQRRDISDRARTR